MKSKTPVLVLAILGAVGALFLGSTWLSDWSEVKPQVKALEKAFKEAGSGALDGKFAEVKRLATAAYLLVLGGIAGIVAAIAFQMGKIDAKVAGIILIACALVPGLLAARSLVFSFLLPVAGVLALVGANKGAPPAQAPAA